jgi:hypothetical protein
VKVVLPPGSTGAVGLAVSVKSAAFAPSRVVVSPVRLTPPRFLIVKINLAGVPSTEAKLWVPPSAITRAPGQLDGDARETKEHREWRHLGIPLAKHPHETRDPGVRFAADRIPT